jgi:insertion element IS1 protein InsB
MNCPRCGSKNVVNNGHTHSGKQNFKCQECARQFVMEPRPLPISQEKKEIIDKLL